MTGDDVRAKHRQYLMPTVLTYYEEPLVVDRAKGFTVWDAEGRAYLDFFGGILTVSLSHANEEVNGAVKAQLDRFGHTSTLYPNEPVVRLAETLASTMPPESGLTQSFFVASGTEADEMAVMLAMTHTDRYEVIALRNGYAGRSLLAQSLMGHANWRNVPQQIAGIKHAIQPDCYRCPLKLKYPDCGLACARDVENIIQYTTTGQVAAFLAEPVQGVGGFVVPPKEYFQVVVEIVRKYGGLFIADEVQTGFGRTGTHWWGWQHFGVTPDIVTMAKGIANGLPAANCMTRPEIAKSIPRQTLSTFGGNPLAMAAANATMDVMQREDVRARAERVGGRLRDGLEALRRRFPTHLGDVRGLGLMQAIELVADEPAGDRTPNPALTARVFEAAKAEGLLVGKGGRWGNVFRIAPPMLVGEGDVDDALAMLARAFEKAGAR